MLVTDSFQLVCCNQHEIKKVILSLGPLFQMNIWGAHQWKIHYGFHLVVWQPGSLFLRPSPRFRTQQKRFYLLQMLQNLLHHSLRRRIHVGYSLLTPAWKSSKIHCNRRGLHNPPELIDGLGSKSL